MACYTLLMIASCALVAVSASWEARLAFEDSRIVPDLVSKGPKKACRVIFPSGAYARLGNNISTKLTTEAPAVLWTSDACFYHTMLILDPDVPTPRTPILRSLQHQVVVNIQNSNMDSGETLVSYIKPTPPPLSDPHRYVILVYRHADLIDYDEPRILDASLANRTHFNLEHFVEKYNLGDPFCGNFFYAEYEN